MVVFVCVSRSAWWLWCGKCVRVWCGVVWFGLVECRRCVVVCSVGVRLWLRRKGLVVVVVMCLRRFDRVCIHDASVCAVKTLVYDTRTFRRHTWRRFECTQRIAPTHHHHPDQHSTARYHHNNTDNPTLAHNTQTHYTHITHCHCH